MKHSIAVALCAVGLRVAGPMALAQEPLKMSDDTIAQAGEKPAIETKEESPEPTSVDGRLKPEQPAGTLRLFKP